MSLQFSNVIIIGRRTALGSDVDAALAFRPPSERRFYSRIIENEGRRPEQPGEKPATGSAARGARFLPLPASLSASPSGARRDGAAWACGPLVAASPLPARSLLMAAPHPDKLEGGVGLAPPAPGPPPPPPPPPPPQGSLATGPGRKQGKAGKEGGGGRGCHGDRRRRC